MIVYTNPECLLCVSISEQLRTMKKNALFAVIFLLSLSACTNYEHRKTVENRTRNTVMIQTGCCGNEMLIPVAPNSKEVVFECVYQTHRKPKSKDLSWNVSSPNDLELSAALSNPKNWIKTEKGKELGYLFIIEE